jgi:FtsH-binding integral membrane protein
MQIMLSKHQQKNVWNGWLDSEARAHYFAELCGRYHQTQRWITWTILVASSGAAAAILSELSPGWSWLRLVLVLVSTALSLWLLVANHNRNATEFATLYIRWNRLAIDYEALWANMSLKLKNGWQN